MVGARVDEEIRVFFRGPFHAWCERELAESTHVWEAERGAEGRKASLGGT
jgi:hypothetical protein